MAIDFGAIDNAVGKTNTHAPIADADAANKLAALQRIESALNVKFSEEQRAVIYHTDAPLAITSGAGSGKTTVIVAKKLFRELYYGVPPYSMLAITFSKKAAGELEERYKSAKKRLRLPVLNNPTFKTFHALFYQLIARMMGNMRVAQEGTYTYTLMKLIPQSPLYDRKEILQAILDYRSKLINNSLSYDGITSSKIANTRVPIENEPFKADTYFRVISEYNNMKQEKREIDFDDMLVYMYRMTVESPDERLIGLFQQTFKEIYIDEYQDSSEIIISIFDVLIQDKSKLTVIGDDDQTIYSFRGSRDYYILNFQYRYPNAQMLFLGANYRCPSNILNPVIASITQNKSRLDKQIRAHNEGGEIYFYPIDNAYDQLVDMLLDELNLNFGSLGSVAILVRVNMQKTIFADLLAAANVPVDLGNMYSSLRQNKVYKVIFGIINAIKSEDNKLFTPYARMFLPSINYNVIKRYQNNETDNWYDDLITRNRYLIDDATVLMVKHIKETNNTKDMVRHVWLLVKEYYENLSDKGFGNLEQTISVIRYIAQCAGDLTYDQFRRNENIKEMFLQSYIGIPNTINISTLHSVKGLEFDSVYMVGLDNDVFPNAGHVEYLTQKSLGMKLEPGQLSPLDEYLSEERRLFYVGWTRAKKRLVVAFNAKKPTCFLNEVDHPNLRSILSDLSQHQQQ